MLSIGSWHCNIYLSTIWLSSNQLRVIIEGTVSLTSPFYFLFDQKVTKSLIFWGFVIFYKIFPSRHVKRNVIISKKYGTCELPHNFPKNMVHASYLTTSQKTKEWGSFCWWGIFADGCAWVPLQENKQKRVRILGN